MAPGPTLPAWVLVNVVLTTPFMVLLLNRAGEVGSNAAPVDAGIPTPPPDWPGWQYKWRDDRYNLWLGHLQWHMVPNFTTTGFELVDTPPLLQADLKRVLEAGLRHPEHKDDAVNIVVNHGNEPDFIENESLNRRAALQLHEMHEKWCGTKLHHTATFGFRVYRDGNVLKKHVDRVETHIISSIIHVGRDVDETWPIVILNNTGAAVAVDIPPGKMLFYESAKLMHWRPGRMKGNYYASIFNHYRPQSWSLTAESINEKLPADWAKGTTEDIAYQAQDAEAPFVEEGTDTHAEQDAHADFEEEL